MRQSLQGKHDTVRIDTLEMLRINRMSQGLSVVNIATESSRWAWADWAGMTASIGCAIHCAAMPLVLAYLPLLGLEWLADEGFHQYMAILCVGLAIAAFVPGWRKHRSLTPMAWGIAGLFLLNGAAFGLEDTCCPPAGGEEVVSCTESACSACEVVEEPADVGPVAMAGLVIPFVTPIGGLLLIVGHVVNHQKRGRCQNPECCLATDAGDESNKA